MIRRFPVDVTAAEIRSLSPPPPFEAVRGILEQVRTRGDAALLEFEARFGTSAAGAPEPAPPPCAVPAEYLDASLAGLTARRRSALEVAVANVEAVARAQIGFDQVVDLPQGHSVTLREHAVASAAAYVPGGRGSYPSTAIMCIVPAQVAGVERVVVTTPARGPDGLIDPTVAAVCALRGVTEVYPYGGAHAVAALGFGTEAIAAVDVIVGPGNAFVQEAKRQLVGRIGIDGVAGPSELVVVAGGGADPGPIALDLRAQGEHGPDSLLALITTDTALLDAVIDAVGEIPAELATVIAHDLESAVELAARIAPEHLQLIDPAGHAHELAGRVTTAGAVFIGTSTGAAFGDYVLGSNHVLPTGGAARHASALSPRCFRRVSADVTLHQDALDKLAPAAIELANAEGFPLHAKSMAIRASDYTADPQRPA